MRPNWGFYSDLTQWKTYTLLTTRTCVYESYRHFFLEGISSGDIDMVTRLGRHRYEFVRVDIGSVIIFSAIGVAIMVAVGKLVTAGGLVQSFYASPFVALSALMANRVCIRAGMLTAALGCVAHEFVFAMPYYQLNVPSAEQALAYSSNFLAAYLVARRTPHVPPAKHPSAADGALPFTATNSDSTRKFWVVSGAGHDWADDVAVGAEYGRIYIEALRASGPAPALSWIIRDMIGAGRFTGVEAGFVLALARAARQKTISEK